MDILSLLRNSPGAQAWLAQQAPSTGLSALGLSQREMLDREMSYDGSHPRQQEQAARDHFRSYGPQTLADAFIPGYGAGGDAKAASEAYGEGRYGAAALNAGMAALDFLPFLGVLPAAAKGIRAYHGGGGDVAKAAGDRGAWFSEARDLADEYAFGGGSVREAEITPAKPISFVHAEQRRPIGDLISTALEGAGDLSDEVISRARPIIDRLNARYGGESKPLFEYWNNDRDVADLFRALGYDSISVAEKSGGPKTWAALDPAIISTPAPKGIRAFHGSPHDFDRFDMSKIGTGEGAQAYGHGLYFAESEGVAKAYRDNLSRAADNAAITEFRGKSIVDFRKQPLETVEPEQFAIHAHQAFGSIGKTRAEREKNALRILQLQYPDAPQEYRARVADIARAAKPEEFKTVQGRMYEVNINADPEAFLDWDKPLSEQPGKVRAAVEGKIPTTPQLRYSEKHGVLEYSVPGIGGDGTARRLGRAMKQPDGSWRVQTADGQSFAASSKEEAETALRALGEAVDPTGREIVGRINESALRDAGIPGIKYLDAGSRGAGDGSRNYVVFDDRLITILRKYGIGGLIAGGGAYALTDAEYAQAAELLAQDGMNTGAQ